MRNNYGVTRIGIAERCKPLWQAADPHSRLSAASMTAAASWRPKPAPAPVKTLSVRAQNVLKELAVELTGEQPPRGTLAPSHELLLALTVERLGSARNCGPRTAREIIAWAHDCGVTIKPPVQVGRSLSQMWAKLATEASRGSLTSAEIIAALEKSIRRKSARIPVTFQIVLLKILISTFE
jgi:hypothetical protein